MLTLLDEVRAPMPIWPWYQLLTVAQIEYAWQGRKTWGESVSQNL